MLAFGPRGLWRVVAFLTRAELAEDPHDLIAGWLVRESRTIGVGAAQFAGAYLLAHGAIKLFLVGGLMRERRWVFPVALVFLGVFVLYQIYRLTQHPSATLFFVTVLDLAIIVLVWQEWRTLGPAD